jgi:hypothetical protein
VVIEGLEVADVFRRFGQCRATIKVRKPDNQDEKVVALLVSKGGRSPTEGASSATISLSFFEGRRVR